METTNYNPGTTTDATPQAAFVLWYRPPKAPGRRRHWVAIGTYASEREAWQAAYTSSRGSGDYQILPAGQSR